MARGRDIAAETMSDAVPLPSQRWVAIDNLIIPFFVEISSGIAELVSYSSNHPSRPIWQRTHQSEFGELIVVSHLITSV